MDDDDDDQDDETRTARTAAGRILELQFWFRDESGEEEFKMWRFGMEQEQQQVPCMVEEVMKAGVGYRRYCRLWSGAGRGGGAGGGGGGKEQGAAAAAAPEGRPHHEDEVSSSSYGRIPWRSCRVRFEISQSLAL